MKIFRSICLGLVIFITLFSATFFIIFIFSKLAEIGSNDKVQQSLACVAAPEIKAAMLKMGPQKRYRILIKSQLQVYQDGQWLNLQMDGDQYDNN